MIHVLQVASAEGRGEGKSELVQKVGGVTRVDVFIEGDEPEQKWLKDLKDSKLANTDIAHYQKIVVVLSETDRIMKEIAGIKIIEK